MKFVDWLDSVVEFSGEVVTEEWESEFSFEWDDKTKLTGLGREIFKKILNSDCVIQCNDVVRLSDKTITDYEIEFFLGACAGYCSQSDYDEWFKHIDDKKED